MTALPMIAVIVPVYKMFLNIGLLDSIPGSNPVSDSFCTSIWNLADEELYGWRSGRTGRSSMVDGATTMQSIRKIVAPLMFPGICVVFIYTFSGSWGNFFYPVYSAEFQNKTACSCYAVSVLRSAWNDRIRSAGCILDHLRTAVSPVICVVTELYV